ncbi:MarR family winged helix-turn-helix transcriptional regulator [Alsobacter sp. SYSU BS001988]|jgi:MarR family transcriptional regulator for hemolysin
MSSSLKAAHRAPAGAAGPGPERRPATPERELGFLIADAARLLRTYTDQRAREIGTTRAQWAVLNRLERRQGMSQNELACVLDVQPITLARQIDRLCDDGLVERRPDPGDRRLKRLFLTQKAYPVLDSLSAVGGEIMGAALAGLDRDTIAALIRDLGVVKDNLKQRLHLDGAERTDLSSAKTKP